jgi:predicted DNA-binding protein (MmcQ/YjbR family)
MIEQEIFKKCTFNKELLTKYGFKNNVYKTTILDNKFKVVITIKDTIEGRVYDTSFDDYEYTSFRIEDNIGSFANTVKEAYIDLLNDIKHKCCKETLFIYSQTNDIVNKVKEKYGDYPIFKWDDNECGVLENSINHKWYGLITPINKNKLDNKTNKTIEILNIKLDPKEIEELLKKEGFYKAWHMNKKYWITIILDNTLSTKEIMSLIDKSYNLVKPKK